jgi:murein DD-endopeptidase / murein LD-carboxypeptidase
MKNRCLLTLALLLSQLKVVAQSADHTWLREQEKSYYSQTLGFDIPQEWNKCLYDTIETWLGTPYRFAGCTREGTDCSGFVNSLYTTVFKSNLGARNSGDIYKKITKVDKDELIEGDLVFFRIRKRRVSHVGVYLGNNKFVHASTSSGVIISDLNEPYYKKFYAGGGRIPTFSINSDVQ